ncbi:hypothetical protein CVT26_010446 [Gymnopilus dilepis]|uniref:Uncharacterized protein n=1 Tax=Gymnopilus dilepis TaxID=231916 RepID=A0A409Y0K5_9AGAR|nr:hypothetical protein CVT26_010446 [Gymnopilus dilepis]
MCNQSEFPKFYVDLPQTTIIENPQEENSSSDDSALTVGVQTDVSKPGFKRTIRHRRISTRRIRFNSWSDTLDDLQKDLRRKRKFAALQDLSTTGAERILKRRRATRTPSSYRATPENLSSHHSSISPCYSLASSRTASTDYGIYFRRRAFSLDTSDEESDDNEIFHWRGVSIVKEEPDLEYMDCDI